MRIAGWIAGLVALALVAFFALTPGITERGMNRIEGNGVWPVSARAAALHKTLTIADMHGDTSMRQRPAATSTCRGWRRAMSRSRCSVR
jgi:membrane dipeptidase